jgi:hypothetical protein
MVPAHQVRRAFALIKYYAPAVLEAFLMYFAEVYIGFTEVELQLGAAAFQPGTTITQRREETPIQQQQRF